MINTPEIDEFFTKDSFTPEEVNELVDLLKKKYKHSEFKKAKQYIDLKLLRFKLAPSTSSKNRNSNKKKPTPSKYDKIEKKRKKYYLIDLSVQFEIPEVEIKNIIFSRLGLKTNKTISHIQMIKCFDLLEEASQKYRNIFNPDNYSESRKLSVKKLAKVLQWPLTQLQYEIFNVTGKRYVRRLGRSELIILSPLINKRRKNLKRIHRNKIKEIKMHNPNKKKKLKEPEKNSQYNVYDKAREVGGIGKLIYIRSK